MNVIKLARSIHCFLQPLHFPLLRGMAKGRGVWLLSHYAIKTLILLLLTTLSSFLSAQNLRVKVYTVPHSYHCESALTIDAVLSHPHGECSNQRAIQAFLQYLNKPHCFVKHAKWTGLDYRLGIQIFNGDTLVQSVFTDGAGQFNLNNKIYWPNQGLKSHLVQLLKSAGINDVYFIGFSGIPWPLVNYMQALNDEGIIIDIN